MRRGALRSIGIASSILLVCAAITFFLSVHIHVPPSLSSLAAKVSGSDAVLLDRLGRPLQRIRIDRSRRLAAWTPLSAFSPALIQAVLAAEDRRFYDHGGMDLLALGAVLREVLHGQRLRGASTITMQLATVLGQMDADNMAEPGSSAALRKVFQVRDALALEREWTKPEILEAYLNLVPMRGDLAGMPAGSYGLLGKGPGDVDGAEAAVLAALIRQPSARPATLATRACKALRERNPNDDCLSVQMISDALPRSPLHLPGEGDAPHLGRQLLTRAGSSVRCTLDRDLQRFVTDALRNRLAELEGRNVADGAAIVIDNSSGEILAYVGSGEEYSSATEVDGVRALRQPGSTLKPFLYAVAIDHGWLNASSIIQDAPFTLATPVGLYAPQDYEHDYKGPVSLRTALASSLNTPAVRTLDLVGVDRFLQTLRSLGLSSLRKDARDYGVGLALGDGEASLLELTNAYRALANGGRWTPATVRVDGEVDVTANSSPTTVFSPGAAFIIGDILADSGARAPTFGLASALNAGMWAAVKTGTSKGMRDNWAIGFTDRYTVGVWVGNFSGASMWDVSGVTGAAPLWHDVVEWLHASKPSRSPAPPAAVHTERVRFQPAIEPSRTEWVLSSTDVCASCESQVRTVEMQPVAAQPRLVLPADGSVVAPDPDIPEARQRIRIEAQGPAYAHVEIDGHAVARSGVFEVSVPLPPPGRHEVNLIGSRGEVLASSTIAIRSLVVHKGS